MLHILASFSQVLAAAFSPSMHFYVWLSIHPPVPPLPVEIAVLHRAAEREAAIDRLAAEKRAQTHATGQTRDALDSMPELLGVPGALLEDMLLEELEVQRGIRPTPSAVHDSSAGVPTSVLHQNDVRTEQERGTLGEGAGHAMEERRS